jgi:hypothetical protein
MSPALASSHHIGRGTFCATLFAPIWLYGKVALMGALLARVPARSWWPCELMGLTAGRRNARKIEVKSCYPVRYALCYPQSPSALDACVVIS